MEKHPQGMDPDASCLLEGEPEMANPITFEGLDAEAIKKAALHTHGAAGPSGLDANAWRRLCSSFKAASTTFARRSLAWEDELQLPVSIPMD